MIKPGFLLSAQREELEALVRSLHEDHGIARRANAILLLDDGWSCDQAGKALYLDDDTIRNWYKQYQQGGIDLLTLFDWKGGHSRMSLSQETQLCDWLEGRFCRSTDEIRHFILSEFGVSYSRSGCIKLLGRLEFEYRKPKLVPRVADAKQQAVFIEQYEQLLNNLGDDEAVYFCDAVHPEYQTKPAHG